MDWQTLLTIVSPFLAIISSIIAYLQAVKVGKIKMQEVEKQSQTELEKIRESHKTELEKMRESHKNDLEKIQIEMETQAKLYEQNKQSDLVENAMNGIMGNLMKNPTVQKKLEEEFQKAFK